MQEVINRSIEDKFVPSFAALQVYMPNAPLIYTSAGHRIAVLGSAVAKSLVEYHTHLDRVVARTQRVCSLPTRITKAQRLGNFKKVHDDWGYTAWACGTSLNDLLHVARPALTSDQIEHTEFYVDHLLTARDGTAEWSLPEDAIRLRAIEPERDEAE